MRYNWPPLDKTGTGLTTHCLELLLLDLPLLLFIHLSFFFATSIYPLVLLAKAIHHPFHLFCSDWNLQTDHIIMEIRICKESVLKPPKMNQWKNSEQNEWDCMLCCTCRQLADGTKERWWANWAQLAKRAESSDREQMHGQNDALACKEEFNPTRDCESLFGFQTRAGFGQDFMMILNVYLLFQAKLPQSSNPWKSMSYLFIIELHQQSSTCFQNHSLPKQKSPLSPVFLNQIHHLSHR